MYELHVNNVQYSQVLSTEDLPGAYKFLSRHFINKKQYDDAAKYAQKCCDYAEVRRASIWTVSAQSTLVLASQTLYKIIFLSLSVWLASLRHLLCDLAFEI